MVEKDALIGKLGFVVLVGGGRMGEALLAGMIGKLGMPASMIAIVEPKQARLQEFQSKYGCTGFTSIDALADSYVAEPKGASAAAELKSAPAAAESKSASAANPTTVILAVKPQVIKDVMRNLAQVINSTQETAAGNDQVEQQSHHSLCGDTNSKVDGLSLANVVRPRRVISIAAGVTRATLKEFFPNDYVIRVMPNVALLAGEGASAICGGLSEAERSEVHLVRDFFACMGEAVVVPEALINAATAISGSGPAYFARLAMAMAEAGEALGLPPETAATLARQTLVGTAAYLQQTGASPKELAIAVASPGGTTEAALESFTADNFEQVVYKAADAAVSRAEKLA
ncbi:MAG: pyrroline-5-carboxylate reductase [Coriobacteriales bacterium]|jgi:pyrroline-5-carboxylate reductase|nr:pyrroline-5-carboxylate reductase [Coriobacteriales bacterium]